jgi:hypothetical protein
MSETLPADIIVGVDTHKHIHAAVAITALGARLGTLTIPVGGKGYQALELWARSLGSVRAFGVEGTGCYGAACPASFASGDMPSSRLTGPIASSDTSRARVTPLMLKPRRAPCWAAKPWACQNPVRASRR